MREVLARIKAEALKKLNESGADLEQIRIQYLGKKGELTSVLRGMGSLSAEERPVIGQLANDVRVYIEKAIAEKSAELNKQKLEMKLKSERLDVTMPGTLPAAGHVHPLTKVQRELEDIFITSRR